MKFLYALIIVGSIWVCSTQYAAYLKAKERRDRIHKIESRMVEMEEFIKNNESSSRR